MCLHIALCMYLCIGLFVVSRGVDVGFAATVALSQAFSVIVAGVTGTAAAWKNMAAFVKGPAPEG